MVTMDTLLTTIPLMGFLLLCLIYVFSACFLYAKYKSVSVDGIKAKTAYWGSAWYNFLIAGAFILGAGALYINKIGGFTLPL